MVALENRLDAVEGTSVDLDAAVASFETIAVQKINDAIGPALEQFEDIAQLGVIFEATSTTTHSSFVGTQQWQVSEDGRARYAPAGVVAISCDDDPTIWMAGNVVGYDRDVGILTVAASLAYGTDKGQHSSWTIFPATAVLPFGDPGTLEAPVAGVVPQKAFGSLVAGRNPSVTEMPSRVLAFNFADGSLSWKDAATGLVVTTVKLGKLLDSAAFARLDATTAFQGVQRGVAPPAGDRSAAFATSNWTAVEVATQLAALVASAPDTLNTLKELADALGDDPNFATTINGLIGARAKIDGTTPFTGTISGVAPAAGDRSAKFGTTTWTGGEIATAVAAAVALLIRRDGSTAFTAVQTGVAPPAADRSAKMPTSAWVGGEIATAINGLLNGAPGALDTLKELADAINDDANFAGTVTTSLGNRLRFDAGQTLTNAQVIQAWSNLSGFQAPSSINSATQLTAADILHNMRAINASGDFALTLPDTSTISGGWTTGTIQNDTSAYLLTVQPVGSQTLEGVAGGTVVLYPGQKFRLFYGNGTWRIDWIQKDFTILYNDFTSSPVAAMNFPWPRGYKFFDVEWWNLRASGGSFGNFAMRFSQGTTAQFDVAAADHTLFAEQVNQAAALSVNTTAPSFCQLATLGSAAGCFANGFAKGRANLATPTVNLLSRGHNSDGTNFRNERINAMWTGPSAGNITYGRIQSSGVATITSGIVKVTFRGDQ